MGQNKIFKNLGSGLIFFIFHLDQRGCRLRKPVTWKPLQIQTSGWSQWLRLEKYFFSRLSLEVEKCHFSLGGALIDEKGHLLAVFQGRVDFGSLYLKNGMCYRLLVGSNGSGMKNTFFFVNLEVLKMLF